jgi:hypothetical protein
MRSRPRLRFDATAIPEPGALGLLGLGERRNAPFQALGRA